MTKTKHATARIQHEGPYGNSRSSVASESLRAVSWGRGHVRRVRETRCSRLSALCFNRATMRSSSSMPLHDSAAQRIQQRVGSTLRGKYRLERLLGIGGMGAV